MLRYRVFKEAGLPMDGSVQRILPRSLGNLLEEMDVPSQEQSRMLRHTSTKTTEMFYTRMKAPKARERVVAGRKNRLTVGR